MNFLFAIEPQEEQKRCGGLRFIMDPSPNLSDRPQVSSQRSGPIARVPASSAVGPNAHPDEDWTKISDLSERRRIQNRIAQRNFRQKKKKRAGDTGKRAHSTSPDCLRNKTVEPRELSPAAKRRASEHEQQTSPSGVLLNPVWTPMQTNFASTPGTPRRVDDSFMLPSQPDGSASVWNPTLCVSSAAGYPSTAPVYSVPDYGQSVAYADYFQYPSQPGFYTPDPAQTRLPSHLQYQNTETAFYAPEYSWAPYHTEYAPATPGTHATTFQHPHYYYDQTQVDPQPYPYEEPPECATSGPQDPCPLRRETT